MRYKTYQITAVRSTARDNSAQFTVKLAISGGGVIAITSESDGENLKMAT